MWTGKLMFIHTTSRAGARMVSHQTATLVPGAGIEGDRYAIGTGKYSPFPDIREVTLIESEVLAALKQETGIDLSPDEHRRNLTTEGVPLNTLVGQRFWVGAALLEGGRLNVPCRYLDMMTRKRVFAPLAGRSGLNCRIITGADIHPGDAIKPA